LNQNKKKRKLSKRASKPAEAEIKSEPATLIEHHHHHEFIHDLEAAPSLDSNHLLDNLNATTHLPLIPLLSIDSEMREKGPAVILTWRVFDLKLNQMCQDKFLDEMDIKEYELYGYREQHATDQTKANWTYIGPVKPYKPPIRCTLTDFIIGSLYHFSVRIKDKQGRLSSYSKPTKIRL
jgi:hypothetical protein